MTLVIVFVDTSALFALVDRDDEFHGPARSFFPELATRTLVTHNYVVVEMIALVQARLGLAAARAFVDDFRRSRRSGSPRRCTARSKPLSSWILTDASRSSTASASS